MDNSSRERNQQQSDNEMNSKVTRKVYLNSRSNGKFSSNQVITARYSILTWLPKSLLYQFARMGNIYYLIVSILCFFPFSPRNPFTVAGTFIVLLLFTSIKEGIEDISRHRQDKSVNHAPVLRFDRSSCEFKKAKSQEIIVGDVIKVLENQIIPADLIFIASSNPKGQAFLNTMSLDGETNLKEKIISHLTQEVKSEKDLSELRSEFEVDHPNLSLVSWNCNMKTDLKLEPLSTRQLLLRGCVLKNTDWVYGLVIYTGEECKIVLNSKHAPTKSSLLLKEMNRVIYTIMGFLLIVGLICGGLGKEWNDNNQEASMYIDLPSSFGGGDFFIRTITYMILFMPMLPIFTYVILEVQRLILCSFINNDMTMYYEKGDRCASWRDSGIIESLGQIKFIFSDKTGTLTRNEMELLKISLKSEIFQINTKETQEIIKSRMASSQSDEDKLLINFFKSVIVCNSVFPAYHDGQLVYHSVSPDEVALVEASKNVGFEIKERKDSSLILYINEKEEIVEILAEIPFTADRKRMSTIIKNSQGDIYLYTKGADNVVLPLLNLKDITGVTTNIKTFAEEGLRTLVMCGRKIEKRELDDWITKWKTIMLSNSKDKDEQLDQISKEIETDLDYYGVSAIEDKLQEGVPETIELLKEANIKIWVLTGDKEETAIEIAKSCNLIDHNSKLIKLFGDKPEGLVKKLEKMDRKYNLQNSSFKELEAIRLDKEFCIALNGLALAYIKEKKYLTDIFFKLAYMSMTCICCRLSPAQKCDIVKICRSFGDWATLSIGDGANDVSMIQASHVGIGIVGKEGTQALLAAEYSLAQFSHLKQLILVHGRYAYFRLSQYCIYFLYKNFLIVFCEAWLAPYSGFSGQIYYLDWVPSFYNLFWTSWPCISFYALEQDISPEASLHYPQLYSAGQKNAHLNLLIFWRWILFGFYSGTVCFWMSIGSLQSGVGSNGHETGLFWASTTSFMILMNVVQLKLLIVSRFWNKINASGIILSLVVFYVIMIMLNSNRVAFYFQPEFPGMFFEVMSYGKTWVIVILGAAIALIPDFLYECITRIYFPSPQEKFYKHQIKNGKVNASYEAN